MARIGAADNRERRRSSALNQARIQPRYLRRAPHIEVESFAPKLLDAFHGLARFEPGFDDVEIVPLIGAGLLSDGMNDGREIGIEYAEAHGVRRSCNARDGDKCRC